MNYKSSVKYAQSSTVAANSIDVMYEMKNILRSFDFWIVNFWFIEIERVPSENLKLYFPLAVLRRCIVHLAIAPKNILNSNWIQF